MPETCIAIIDDRSTDRDLIRIAASDIATEVSILEFNDGSHFFEFLNGSRNLDRHVTECSIPLFFVDMKMQRINGPEVIQELRKHVQFQESVVYVLSDSNATNDHVSAGTAGCDVYRSKPIDIKGYRRVVSDAFEAAGLTGTRH